MKILDGKVARDYYVSILKDKISKLSYIPNLVIIQVGSRADSDSFIKAKKAFAEKIGVKEIHIKLPENISEKEIVDIIKDHNNDKSINGIIVQLPLPQHLNPDSIISNIDPKKDIDGLTLKTKFMPATARGIKELFKFYNIELESKKVTVVGQSNLVGKPIAQMCREQGAIVTVCDSKTKDLEKETRNADIVIVAIGKPKFINEKHISKGQIVIDVGITRDGESLSGDVDFEKVKGLVSMISPVPGGVGVMTVLALFENLIDSCYNDRY